VSPRPTSEQSTNSLFVEDVTLRNVLFGAIDPSLRFGIAQEFQRRFDGLQVLRCQKHDVVATVLGYLHPVMSGRHFLGDLNRLAFTSESGSVVIRPLL
jgi:hypothetical protein